MFKRRVLVSLPTDAYRRLAELAESEERVVDQQASLLLKRLLSTADPHRPDTTHRLPGARRAIDVQTDALEHEAEATRLPSVVEGRDGGLS